MIEGGYKGQKGVKPLATSCAKQIEPLLDHLGQQLQLGILAAVETVISEYLGFSQEVENQKPDGYYTQPAREAQELLTDPKVREEVEAFVKKHGGTQKDLPW
jgi:hypothetical protein